MNIATIIIIVILSLLVIGIIIYLIKNRKKGCCGCDKDNCPYRNHPKDKINRKE